MEFKGTKGEWNCQGKTIYGEEICHRIALIDNIFNEEGELNQESNANAKLIAAAPDLLEALQSYLNAGHKEARKEASVLAKKAITKALK